MPTNPFGLASIDRGRHENRFRKMHVVQSFGYAKSDSGEANLACGS